ncbi:hypothetical protein GCM10022233_49870 [Streptomyces shaanxiensis]|uniref:Uncharacterized protein n=1 Tax=Streptomyces shaanxiensis TaxID=653357 RepID=A0ABP7VJL3_9ACTN
MPTVTMLPCAPTPGTEILTGRIPVGSQNGDSAEGTTRGGNARNTSTNRGEEGGSNASLEGLAG